MKLRKSRLSRRGRIEIIPMIDVMFFLLATFILASLSMQNLHSITINLPQGKAQAIETNTYVTIAVTKQSAILLNGAPVTLDNLAEKIQPILKSIDDPVIIAADNDVPEGMVVQTMLHARMAGVQHFMIAIKNNE
ncbi:MAG: biopolymer transporter ExbD [Nitrospirae bacterium]|nr:biopolymer transporter ExbD [Nitrospirota bacterium]